MAEYAGLRIKTVNAVSVSSKPQNMVAVFIHAGHGLIAQSAGRV